MKKLMIVAAVISVGACRGEGASDKAGANAAAANKAAPAAAAPATAPDVPAAGQAAPAAAASATAALPEGFPGNDEARSVMCELFLGLSRAAKTRPGGFDDTALEQAQGQWRNEFTHGTRVGEEEVQALAGRSLASLQAVPAAQRDAASAWCVKNVPELDPEG